MKNTYYIKIKKNVRNLEFIFDLEKKISCDVRNGIWVMR